MHIYLSTLSAIFSSQSVEEKTGIVIFYDAYHLRHLLARSLQLFPRESLQRVGFEIFLLQWEALWAAQAPQTAHRPWSFRTGHHTRQ
jgi:8-oxo-dGTP pyrophosphatase MutT (NUDIX family)